MMTKRMARRHGRAEKTLHRCLLATGMIVPLLATAQPVLHEPVSVPRLRCKDGVCRPDGAPSDAMPDAVMSREGLLTAPSSGRGPTGQEQIFASGATTASLAHSQGPQPGTDPPPVRRSRILPDSATGPETGGERLYHEVFQPAVYPYKRMSVLDGVDDDGAMKLRRSELIPMPVEKSGVAAGRDPFYASVVVDFVAGQAVPLPTPAAGFRILSYRSTPARSLQFYVDGAENLYVSSPTGGRHRLVYLMDVGPRYFAGPLLPPGTPAPLLGDVPDDMLAPLPRKLQREAKVVLQHIGVRTSSGADYQSVLAQLVNYFRGFTVGDLPDEGPGDLYLKLALSRRGACRHRSYVFVITALQAGIPARYVENELHVFVEVWIPDARGRGGYFRRINLGGAPLSQRIVDGENKVAYREKGGDPFPTPPSFQSGVPPQVQGQPRQRGADGGGSGGNGDAGSGGSGPGPGQTGSSSAGDGRKNGPDGTPSSDPGGKGNQHSTEKNGTHNSGTEQSGGAEARDGKGQRDGGKPSGTGPGGTSGKPDGKSQDGSGHDGKTPPGKPSEGARSGGGPDDSSDLPAEDDISQSDDRRVEASAVLATTQVTLSASGNAYRGSSLPIAGIVRSTSGDAAGLEVMVILALSAGPRILGRAVTRSDGRFSTEIDLPGDLPLGNHRLIARVRGDQTRRGSSSARYDTLQATP